MTDVLLPLLLLFVVVHGLIKKIDVYGVFMKGVKEGLQLFVSIYPSLLAMMCAITLLRVSGLMEKIIAMFSFIEVIPSSIWPMVLFRPISGSASLAVLIDIFQTHGVDSFAGMMGSIIQGSTDTTFYVISLYFSHVQVKYIKNALSIGLLADLAGIAMAIALTWLFFT